MKLKNIAVWLVVACSMLAGTVQAGQVVDYSPDTTAAKLVEGFWRNIYNDQILGERFSLTQSTYLTGASIFSATELGKLGDSVHIAIFSATSGSPGNNALIDIVTAIDAIDTQLTSTASSLTRKHASTEDVYLAAGDYWFSMSGITTNIGGASGNYGDGGFGWGPKSFVNYCSTCGDIFFSLEGHSVSEPASNAMLGLALAALAVFRRKYSICNDAKRQEHA